MDDYIAFTKYNISSNIAIKSILKCINLNKSSCDENPTCLYVKKNGKAGVLFLTLEAQSRITCAYAPRAYGLPYTYAKCKLKIEKDNFNWESKRSKEGF